MTPRRSRFSAAAPWIFFGVLLTLVFGPGLLAGRILGGHHDRVDQMIPFYTAYARAFKAGEVPQWNPYIFCGKTAMGSGMFVFFYPLYWAAFAAPEGAIGHVTTLVLVVHVAVAMAGSYKLFERLARRAGGPSATPSDASAFWGVVAAVSYLFSSSLVLQMVTELNFATFAYLPVLLWLVVRDADAGDAGARGLRRHVPRLPTLVAQATVCGLLLLSGNVQLILYAVGILLGWACFLAVGWDGRRPTLNLRPPLTAGLALTWGIGLAAARWVTFLRTQGAEGGTPATYLHFLVQSPVRWVDLARFLAPEIFGTGLYVDFFGTINHFESFAGYAGVLGVALVAASLIFGWRRAAFWNVLFLVVVLTCVGTPLTYLHYVATGRALLHFTRVAWFLPLPVAAIVAVMGPAFFQAGGRRPWLVVGAVLVLGGAYLVAVRSLALPPRAQANGAESIAQFVFVALALLGCLRLAKGFGPESPHFRAAVLVVVLLDLLVTATTEANVAHPFMAKPQVLDYPDIDRTAVALAEAQGPSLYRVVRLPDVHDPRSYDALTINDRWIRLGGMSSAGYDNSAPRRIAQLFTYPRTTDRLGERVLVPHSERVARIASTSHLVMGEELHPIQDPLPRAAFFAQYRVVPDAEALSTLTAQGYDPHRELLVSDETPVPAPAEGRGRATAARITGGGSNAVELQVDAPSAGLVLLNDTFQDGWRVEVDGQPARPLRVNYAFRAVAVSAGLHHVRWTFEQPGLAGGLRTSALAWSLLVATALALGAWALRKPRGSSAVPTPSLT